mmetsp:Transcript_20122/g.56027  ORF Transcript_20122/g.56027 Transcript_20122/m.56027 type:complete len:101 (+) Transcript_20122:207-509(+)
MKGPVRMSKTSAAFHTQQRSMTTRPNMQSLGLRLCRPSYNLSSSGQAVKAEPNALQGKMHLLFLPKPRPCERSHTSEALLAGMAVKLLWHIMHSFAFQAA